MHEIQVRSLTMALEHWERLFSLVLAKDVEGLMKEGWGGKQCQCCRDFFDKGRRNTLCTGCPIKEYTGCTGCGKTPYEEAEHSLDEIESTEYHEIDGITPNLWINAALNVKAEVMFLSIVLDNLLDPNAPPKTLDPNWYIQTNTSDEATE